MQLGGLIFVLSLNILVWQSEALRSGKIQLLRIDYNTTSAIATKSFSFNDLQHLGLYSKWSPWSVCDNSCRQIRIKYCLFNDFRCRGTILKEERFCITSDLHCIFEFYPSYNQTFVRRPIANQTDLVTRESPKNSTYPTKRFGYNDNVITQNGRRVPTTPNSGVMPPKFRRRATTPKSLASGGRPKNQINNDIGTNGPLPGRMMQSKIRIIKMSKHHDQNNPTTTVKPHSLYSKWSSWSKCTRSCITQRIKTCKKIGTCRKKILRETAYCYVEGSPCHQWIQHRYNYDDDEDEEIITDSTEASEDDFELGIRENCGISRKQERNSNGFFYSWPMLRIIGGHISSKRKWPWQVAVLNKYKEAFCGGTLISSRWVLTAAHCVRKRLFVRINEHDISYYDGTEQEYRVEKTITHKDYDPETVDNDIALLKLPIEISQSYACLPRQNQTLPVEAMCTIIGWGKRHMKDEHGANVLHEAQIPIVTRSRCRSVYKNFHITANMFCAGFKHGGHDTCAGDSGGPLLCQSQPAKAAHNGVKPWVLHGVTSFGEGCGRKSKYGIYTAVHNYINWIFEQIKRN